MTRSSACQAGTGDGKIQNLQPLKPLRGMVPAMPNEITWADLERAEGRIHLARGYSPTYRRLLFHSARRVLEANGLAAAEFDPGLRIPIDAESVDRQVRRFSARAEGSTSKPSTTRNYAENWHRFARWVREYLEAEAQGREELYLAPLEKRRRASVDRRRSPALEASAPEEFSMRLMERPAAMAAAPPEVFLDRVARSVEPEAATRRARPQRLVVRTSFGPLEMELPAELSAEDAVRIAAAVLRLAQ